MTDLKGAYVLDLRLRRKVRLALKSLAYPELPRGRYLYCGSANGPGGVAARVGRHAKDEKVLKWHVDYLRAEARLEMVYIARNGDECDLVSELVRRGATVPIPRFGSSDCRNCPSHLLAVDQEVDLASFGWEKYEGWK